MTQTSPTLLLDTVVNALEEMKAKNVTVLDIGEMTSLADQMVIASGTSTRHVKALADTGQEKIKEAGFMPVGVEGEQSAEWILVDLGDVIVHVMQPSTREYYDLERLWRNPAHHPDRKET